MSIIELTVIAKCPEFIEWFHSVPRSDVGKCFLTITLCHFRLPQLFKAPEFVHKHLINKHPEKHKLVVDQVNSCAA